MKTMLIAAAALTGIAMGASAWAGEAGNQYFPPPRTVYSGSQGVVQGREAEVTFFGAGRPVTGPGAQAVLATAGRGHEAEPGFYLRPAVRPMEMAAGSPGPAR